MGSIADWRSENKAWVNNRIIKISQSKEQKGKTLKENEQSLRELKIQIKHPNIYAMGNLEKENRLKEQKKYLKRQWP